MKKLKDKFKDFISSFDFKEKVIGIELLVILILVFVILFIVCFKVPKKSQNNLDINSKNNNSEVIDSPKEEFNYEYKTDEKLKETPKEEKKETTKKNNTETKKVPSNKENNNIKQNNEEKENTNNNKNNDDSSKALSADEEVISYARSVNDSLDNKSLRESAKDGFITLTDFIFYDGKIKGYTFKELSNKTKLTVLKLVLTIDSKIDKYFPDYKEKISTKYHNIKNNIVTKYLEITTNICKKDKDTCNQAKKDFQDMKKSFSLTWDFIKDLASSGKASIKEWYEIYSGK